MAPLRFVAVHDRRRYRGFSIVMLMLVATFAGFRFQVIVRQAPLEQRARRDVRPPRVPQGDMGAGIGAIVALLERTNRRDAYVIDGKRIASFGAVRDNRHFFYRPTSNANVGIDASGKHVSFTAFGSLKAAGAFAIPTGVGVRDFVHGRIETASSSFVIPCTTTRLAADQNAYVYFGAFSETWYGRPRLTEIGIQMNPPPGGGRPTSVQLYARRTGTGADAAVGTNLHLRCEAPVTVRFGSVGPSAVAATFSGAAIPIASHRLTIVEKFGTGERLAGETDGDSRIERVTALAVPAGSGSTRRDTKLAFSTDNEPELAFVRDDDFRPPSSIEMLPVVERSSGDRTSVGIDERGAP